MAKADCQRLTILVVDDELVVLHTLTAILEKLGHGVHRARGAAQALELLAGAQTYDLAIIDLVLPGMPGLELITLIRVHHPTFPMIAISGLLAPDCHEVLSTLRSMGVEALRKPIYICELEQAINTAISRSERERK